MSAAVETRVHAARGVSMVGERYGRLVVVSIASSDGFKDTCRRWSCRCDCGKTTVVTIRNLRSGHTESCGCLLSEFARNKATHGHARGGRISATYCSWKCMWDRIKDEEKSGSYKDRGITVCDRWKLFENFLADMGERPYGLTIDRVNNDGNYEPGNCRWATRSQQSLNQRRRSSSKRRAS